MSKGRRTSSRRRKRAKLDAKAGKPRTPEVPLAASLPRKGARPDARVDANRAYRNSLGGFGDEVSNWDLFFFIAGPPAFFVSDKRLGNFSALRFFSRYSCSFHDGLVLPPLIYDVGGFGNELPLHFHFFTAGPPSSY